MRFNDYLRASLQLTGRCKERRKLANNTYLIRRSADSIAVRLHDTDVLTFHSDGHIIVANGGFPTCTTHDRINRYLPAGYCVNGEPVQSERRVNGMTVLCHWTRVSSNADLCHARYEDIAAVTVNNCATINADGTLHGGNIVEYRKERREERNAANRPRNRARYWANKVREGKPFKGTVADILAEENSTVRVAKMTCYGLERFFLDANAKVLEERAGYQLLELPLDDWRKMRALKMACSTTGAVYINPVPPHVDTVADGLDFMFHTKDYLGTIGQQS